MRVIESHLGGPKILIPEKFGDRRGFFSEVYSDRTMGAAGINDAFVQDNHSLSAEAGVVRGLHYQLPPSAQAKLVRVIRGAVLDVVLDLRRSSTTFGEHFSATLSAGNWRQMYVPIGFAHGFVTLEPNTEVLYKVSAPYDANQERGVLWNDPALAIDWGIDLNFAVLSEKDRLHPPLAAAIDFFV